MNHIDKYLDIKKMGKLAQHVCEKYADSIISSSIENNEVTVTVRRGDIAPFLRAVRDDKKTYFRVLLDICGVDYPEREERFDVVYHLLSMTNNMRMRVKVTAGEGMSVPSVVDVYSAANWFERETYDMFGVPFEGHPDLRRILTDYDFDGYPLRKDFPLSGHVEVYYDSDEKRVAYKPVDLPQETRYFDDVSEWAGMTNNKDLSKEDSVFDASEFEDEKQAAAK